MDFAAMKRRDLQALCKKHNLVASGTNSDLVSRLASALKKVEMEEKPLTRHAKKRRVSVGEESVQTVDLGKGLDGKKSKPIPNEAKKKPLASPRVGKDVPAPSRATRSRGGAGEVVDVHSFPDERKKRMRGRGGEAKTDSSDDGSKELAVRATRSGGGGEEAIVPPNVEKTRSKKDGSTKNDSQVKKATSVRTTRSKVGAEVTDVKHSSPVEKKTAKGKGSSTENDDGVKKELSVRTTRSRVGADAVSSHASPSVEKKSKKRGRESTKNDEVVDIESSVRTTRSRQGAEEAVSHSSPPAEKKSTKRGNMSIKNDDGAKEIPARTTRSRVSVEVPVNLPPSPAVKNKPTRGKVSAKDNGVNKEMSVRTTRSRIGEVVPSINRSSSAEKNKAKIGGVNTESNDGVKDIPVRTTRSRLGTETGMLPSPVVGKKKRGRGEMEIEQTKTQKAAQVTRSLRGKEIKGVDVSPEKSDTRPSKRRKAIDDLKEEEVKEAAVLKKSTRQTRPKKMGKEKNGRKGKSILKLKGKTPKQVKRKAITSDRSVTLDRNKESSVKKKFVTPDPGSAPKPEKTPKQSKSSVKKKVVTPDRGSAPKPEKTPKQSKSSVKKKVFTPDPGSAPKPEKTPKQSKRLVEQPSTKATQAGVSNSKHKELVSTSNTVAATGVEMQTDEKSKKAQVQKQVGKSIKSVGKSYSTREKLPQSSTRSGPRRKSRNVDAESSVHEMQGSDDVPSFVTGNGSTQKVNETAGIVKAVAESISFVDDGVSVGVRVVEGGLINSIDEATQLTIDLAGKPYHPVMETETQSVEAVFEESITMGVGGTSQECITSGAKNVEASDEGSVKGCTLSLLDETKHDHLEPSGVDKSKFEEVVDDVPNEEDTETLPSVGGTSRECITGGTMNVEVSEKGSVKGCTLSLLDETKHDHLDPSGVDQSKFEEVVDDAPGEEVTETLPNVGGTVEEAITCQQINELDTAAQKTNNMEGEINHTVVENEGTTPIFEDFPRHSASETTLEFISSTSKDVGKSVHDFVEDHVSSLGDDVMYKAQGGGDDHIETSGAHHANFEESLGIAPIKDFSETPVDMGGGELVRETTACLENNDLDAAPQKTIDVAEEINEADTASQRTIDVEGADSCIKIDGSSLDEENSTGQQITESGSAWKDIDIAGETNLSVMEPGRQNEEPSPISEESPTQSIGGTIDVAEETNELDTSQRTIDVAGADDNIEMDCGTLVDETSTGQEITELATQDIDVAGEIHLPVIELKTQIEEASPISVESPTDGGTFDVAEETNDLDTSSQKSIGVEEGDNHLRPDATPDIDVAGEINCHVMELETHNEEALPVSEEINELDVASEKTIDVAGLDDHMKMGSGMSIEEASTGQKFPGLDTAIPNIDVTGEIDSPAMELKTQNEEASPISEESPIQRTVGSSPEDSTSGTRDVNESEKVSVEDHTLSLSRGQVDDHVDSSTDDHAKFGDFVCAPPTKEVSGTPLEFGVDGIVEETSATEKPVDMTGGIHLSAVKLELHKEKALPLSEEITMLSSVGTSAECIMGVEKDVDDDQKVLAGVSCAKEFSETHLEIIGEKSVEDTSSSEQLNEMGQADPVLDVGHLSTADSLQSHHRNVKDTSIAECTTSDFGVEHVEDASMAFQQSSALSQGKGAIDFDDASAVERVRETSSMMLQESPEGSGGFNTAADTASNVEFDFDKVGEASIVESREVLQEKIVEFREEKHDCNSDKLNMEFGVEHVKEDDSMMLQESPESSQANAKLGFEDIGKYTYMVQETPDASLDHSPDVAELDVEDFGEASVAKSGKVSEENAQNKVTVRSPSEIDAINESFKFLVDQFGDGHPGQRVSQGIPELGVEDVGKVLYSNSQEVFEENIELSKEVNIGSDSDNPNVKVSWDVDENNESPEVSVEEFDHTLGDGEGDLDSRKGEMHANELLESSEMLDRDFDYEFGGDVWGEENVVNAVEEAKPSEGASEMFDDFNEDADMHLHPRVGAISQCKDGSNVVEDEITGTSPLPQVYTPGNEEDEANFGVEHFIQRESWHVNEQYVDDLKNFGISETQSHVEYSQSRLEYSESRVEYSQHHQESADPKISDANYAEGESAKVSLQEEHHDRKKEGEHFAEARKSSPWSSRHEQ